jgi:hypothetical protein
LIAGRIAERGVRPLADKQVIPMGLPVLSSMKNTFGSRIKTGLPS